MLRIELVFPKGHRMRGEVTKRKQVESDQKDEIHLKVYSAS